MSLKTKHLTIGSVQPSKEDGVLRLYSMEYCPYAQRARLILKAKGVKHDIVNINLNKKPEWYSDVHSEGKVPALDTGSAVIVESLDIANFLEQTYPDPPLYPAEPEAIEKDKELIKKIEAVTMLFAKCVFKKEEKTPEEWVKEFKPVLEPFEEELKSRGTTFFGGDKPGMVDYMLWPWGERAKAPSLVLGQKLPFSQTDIPSLLKWQSAMREQTLIKNTYNGSQKFLKCIESGDPDFDWVEG